MAVNVFLSSHSWVVPRNAWGVRHHVAALYEEVFRGYHVNIYPKNPDVGLIFDGVRHLPFALSGEINVLTPGYPIIAGALASAFRQTPSLIVHTWKVPGIAHGRLSGSAYDLLLRRAIDRADAVVLASHVQLNQLRALGVACPALFAPVTVDSAFWRPEAAMDAELAKFALKRNEYVLTVGGNDRDECYGPILSRELGLQYVRATNAMKYVSQIKQELLKRGLLDGSKILVRPSDPELRALYAGARVVCLATITKTNPAGLSALVEALACGAIVAVPESIAEGYVVDGVTGLILTDSPHAFAMRLLENARSLSSLRTAARKFAEDHLNVAVVAARLKTLLLKRHSSH